MYVNRLILNGRVSFLRHTFAKSLNERILAESVCLIKNIIIYIFLIKPVVIFIYLIVRSIL